MAQRKNILVFECEGLLTASILSLLAQRTEYDVFSEPLNTSDSLKQLNNYNPDVLIIEKKHLVENISGVIEVVDRFPGLRLIVLGLEDNKLDIFEKQIVHVEKLNDFLETLQCVQSRK